VDDGEDLMTALGFIVLNKHTTRERRATYERFLWITARIMLPCSEQIHETEEAREGASERFWWMTER
jgi:hypothetical protein